MVTYILRRLLSAFWALLGVVFIVFILTNLSGDPAALMVSPDAPAAAKVIAELRQQLGYDRPFYVRFGLTLARMARGDFGESIRQRRPALETVTERLPATFQLAALAFFLAAVVGVAIGLVSATLKGRSADRLGMLVSLLGLTLPSFWLSALAQKFGDVLLTDVRPPREAAS